VTSLDPAGRSPLERAAAIGRRGFCPRDASLRLSPVRALGIIVVIELAVLALAVGAVLRSEPRETFPTSIAAPAVQRPRGAPASVQVRIVVRGLLVSTRALNSTRGGQAVASPAGP
jgi:hypothetical protein